MTKEIFLLVTKEIKKKRYTNTKKDAQTHNIKKKKKLRKIVDTHFGKPSNMGIKELVSGQKNH